eukprot:356666-Chlamydomonas_euryale.AAC.3
MQQLPQVRRLRATAAPSEAAACNICNRQLRTCCEAGHRGYCSRRSAAGVRFFGFLALLGAVSWSAVTPPFVFFRTDASEPVAAAGAAEALRLAWVPFCAGGAAGASATARATLDAWAGALAAPSAELPRAARPVSAFCLSASPVPPPSPSPSSPSLSSPSSPRPPASLPRTSSLKPPPLPSLPQPRSTADGSAASCAAPPSIRYSSVSRSAGIARGPPPSSTWPCDVHTARAHTSRNSRWGDPGSCSPSDVSTAGTHAAGSAAAMVGACATGVLSTTWRTRPESPRRSAMSSARTYARAARALRVRLCGERRGGECEESGECGLQAKRGGECESRCDRASPW